MLNLKGELTWDSLPPLKISERFLFQYSNINVVRSNNR